MADQRRPDVVTPLRPLDVAIAVRQAWVLAMGNEPARASVVLLCAHIGHETAWHSCHAYNLGNRRWYAGCGYDYVSFATWELDRQGVKHVYDPANPAEEPMCRFCAYDDLTEGARDYIDLLSSRFSLAWGAVVRADPADFANALKALGYYTDTQANYSAGLLRNLKVVDAVIPADVAAAADESPTVPDVAHAAIQQAADQIPIVDTEPPPAAPDTEPGT